MSPAFCNQVFSDNKSSAKCVSQLIVTTAVLPLQMLSDLLKGKRAGPKMPRRWWSWTLRGLWHLSPLCMTSCSHMPRRSCSLTWRRTGTLLKCAAKFNSYRQRLAFARFLKCSLQSQQLLAAHASCACSAVCFSLSMLLARLTYAEKAVC